MAIAKNPNRNTTAIAEQGAKDFILGAGRPDPAGESQKKKPVMTRFHPAILARIDSAAKRLGLDRTSFVTLAAVEKLERMEKAE
jgi:hypothetical protein